MTVSVVARDAETGQLGIATASFALAVGAGVPALRAGVGAVAVQAGAPHAWGQQILDKLVAGSTRPLEDLASDPAAACAQLAVVDGAGHPAVWSGAALEAEVSEARGDGVCVAANLMESPLVAQAALDAYSASTSAFGGRLLEALAAADDLGGDVRGRQSAALRVVGDEGVDLRVDDARDPVAELHRLHVLWQAHRLLAASRGADGLYRHVGAALAAVAMAPDDAGCLGGAALALLRGGDVDRAVPLLRRLSAAEPRTPTRLRRLVDAGLLDAAPAGAALARLEPGA